MDLMQLTELVAGFITVLVLDFKGDFVDVPRRLGREIWYKLSATDGFRSNCGPPFGCDSHYISWINQWTKVISAHCDFKFAEATLASVVRIAVNLLNDPLVYPLKWPSLLLIQQLLEILPAKLISKKDDYLRTAQHKIEHLIRIGGTLFDAEQGFDIIKHLIIPKKCAVIDCTGLSPLLGQILVNMLALQLMFPRITKRQISEQTNTVLVIDEVDPFCSDEASIIYPEGYNVLGQIAKQGRQFGVQLVLGMTRLGRCSPFITSNASYHFIGNQTDSASIDLSAHTLLDLASKQLVASLKCGQFGFKEAMGPVPYSMLMQADHVPASHMTRPEKFDQHPFTPARGIKDIPGLQEKVDHLISEYRKTALRQKKAQKVTLPQSKKERAFLDYASLYEYEPAYHLFERMKNSSPATQQKIIRDLVKKNLIESSQMRTSKSYVRILRPTKEGWSFLQKRSQFKPLGSSFEHEFICRSKQKFDIKRGAEDSICQRQVEGTSHIGDVLSKFGGELYCTEVVVNCISNICDHVKACFIATTKIKQMDIVTLLKSEHKKILEKIMSDPELVFFINRINFLTVDEILKELYGK